jgi:hypothetical protein
LTTFFVPPGDAHNLFETLEREGGNPTECRHRNQN